MKETRIKSLEEDRIEVFFTRKPTYMTYEKPAWWAYTVGRNPDIEVAGPCKTRKELDLTLKAYALEGRLKKRNRQIRDLRRQLRK